MNLKSVEIENHRTGNADGWLLRFLTTSRCFFGSVANRILDERPQAWL